MGGQINIAARFNDGNAICIDGWTNFIPRMVMNETTLSGEDRIVRETLMEAAASEHYEGPQPFRASGYGIVVIDFIEKTIHSMQGYTSFDSKGLTQMLDINACGWKDGQFVQVLSQDAADMLDAGRIKLVSIDGVDVDPEVLTIERTLQLIREDSERFFAEQERKYHQLEVDTAPMTLHEYPEGGPLTKMKEHLRKAGFPVTKADGLNSMFAAKEAEK